MVTMPGVYPVQGGLPVMVDGQCVGGIGVAGVMPDLDVAVAEAGLEALAPATVG